MMIARLLRSSLESRFRQDADCEKLAEALGGVDQPSSNGRYRQEAA